MKCENLDLRGKELWHPLKVKLCPYRKSERLRGSPASFHQYNEGLQPPLLTHPDGMMALHNGSHTG